MDTHAIAPGIAKIVSALVTLGILAVVSALLGFGASRLYKGPSRRNQQAIGTVVAFLCLFASTAFVLWRLNRVG